MKMHIIGTGTATVSKYINTSCVFEEDNQLFLVDGTGGSDILRAFDIMNLDWKHLHHAFLSHEHTDHFLGMIWVAGFKGIYRIHRVTRRIVLNGTGTDTCLRAAYKSRKH